MNKIRAPGAFVGRATELGRLTAALSRAREGRPGLVLLGGEAGVGKTRLVQEFLDLPVCRGAWTTVGTCIDGSGESLPFGPIRIAMRSLCRAIELQVPRKLTPEARAGLDGLGEAAAPQGAYEPSRGSLQLRQFESLLDSIGAVARIRPLIVALEDLHWADLSSLACLSFLITHCANERMLLIATYRTDELHRGHRLRPWIADQLRRPSVELVELPRLSPPETQQMMATLIDKSVPEELGSTIFERSEGNPFFIDALTGAWSERSGHLLPPSLREVLRAQLLPLSDDVLTVLRVAAIGGSSIRPDIIAAILEHSDIDVFEALREAGDRNILVADPDSDAFRFRHALVHEIVLAEVMPGERERLHAAHADQLERRLLEAEDKPAALALIAHHWDKARNSSKAIEYAWRAGTAAMEVGAFADAEEQCKRVLSLWDTVPDAEGLTGAAHVDMLRWAGSAAYLAGDDDLAVSFLNAALGETSEDSEPVSAALLHETIGWINFLRGMSDAAFDAFARALTLVPPGPSAERARILATSARMWMLWGQPRKATELAMEAIEVARAAGSRHEEVLALNPLGTSAALLGDPKRGIELLERSVAASRDLGDYYEEVLSYINLGEARFRLGDVAGAVKTWREGYERACREGLRKREGSSLLCNVAQGLYESGDWDGAERALEEARRWIPRGFTEMTWHELQGHLHVGRGNFGEGHRYLAHTEELIDEGGNPEMSMFLFTALAELALWEERLDAACEYVRRGLAAIVDTTEMVWAGRLLMLGLRAEADRAQAITALDPADRYSAPARAAALVAAATTPDWDPLAPAGHPIATPAAGTCLAELARVEGRLDHTLWADAAERWAAWGGPYHVAYARFREGEARAHGGDRSGAAAALRDAHDIAAKLGARPLLHEISMLARRARVDLSSPLQPAESDEPTPAERLGLTEREMEVLRQLTMGRSNREIAEALFISPKTASVHVSNIMRKLNAPSRLAAASAANRLGLVELQVDVVATQADPEP